MDYFEQSILTYSGLSTETKPTLAAGNTVPNGSRFREIDTKVVYLYNVADDKWYPFELESPTAFIQIFWNVTPPEIPVMSTAPSAVFE